MTIVGTLLQQVAGRSLSPVAGRSEALNKFARELSKGAADLPLRRGPGANAAPSLLQTNFHRPPGHFSAGTT